MLRKMPISYFSTYLNSFNFRARDFSAINQTACGKMFSWFGVENAMLLLICCYWLEAIESVIVHEIISLTVDAFVIKKSRTGKILKII